MNWMPRLIGLIRNISRLAEAITGGLSQNKFRASVELTTLGRNRFRYLGSQRNISKYNSKLSKYVTEDMPPKRRQPVKIHEIQAGTSKVSNNENSTRTPRKRKRMADKEPTDEQTPKKVKLEAKKLINQTESKLDNIDYNCDKLNADGEKYNLKLCSWNVSGIRACIKKNGFDYLVKEDADIIALQETKCEKAKLPDEAKLTGYHKFFVESNKSGYCGVALYSKEKPLNVKYGLGNPTHDKEGRMITAEFERCFVVSVYVPNAGQKLVTLPKRLEWNRDFKAYIQKLNKKKPVIICGDMNVAHKEIDLKNPKTNTKSAGFTKEERDDMTDFLEAGYVDTFRKLYPDLIDAYTFWTYFNNARSKNVGWRIDYFLVSESIKDKVCDNVIRNQIFGSDHCPIVLYINL